MPILSALRSLVRSRGQATRITATPVFLRIEEKTGGKASVVEIPADELDDLEFSDRRPVLSEIDIPGMKKLQDFGDTGTPRLPNGRPVPKILLSLMRMVPSQGITARRGLGLEQLGFRPQIGDGEGQFPEGLFFDLPGPFPGNVIAVADRL